MSDYFGTTTETTTHGNGSTSSLVPTPRPISIFNPKPKTTYKWFIIDRPLDTLDNSLAGFNQKVVYNGVEFKTDINKKKIRKSFIHPLILGDKFKVNFSFYTGLNFTIEESDYVSENFDLQSFNNNVNALPIFSLGQTIEEYCLIFLDKYPEYKSEVFIDYAANKELSSEIVISYLKPNVLTFLFVDGSLFEIPITKPALSINAYWDMGYEPITKDYTLLNIERL